MAVIEFFDSASRPLSTAIAIGVPLRGFVGSVGSVGAEGGCSLGSLGSRVHSGWRQHCCASDRISHLCLDASRDRESL